MNPPFTSASTNYINHEADYDGVGYDEDECDRVDKKIPAKRAPPINLTRNMASKFFNWECTLPFYITPRSEEITILNFLDHANPNPKTISKEYQAECIQKGFPLDSTFQLPSFYHGEKEDAEYIVE
jgi:hypothetical protein